jgi:quinol monooxygenase YgiN
MSTVENASVVQVVAFWQAAPGQRDAVREILRELASLTRREPGCLGFEVLEATGQPGVFVLLERYAGGSARAEHQASPHFHELVEQRAVPLLTHRDVRSYQTLWPDRAGEVPPSDGEEAQDERS